MKISMLLAVAVLTGCTTFTGGDPEFMSLGPAEFFITAKTGPAPFEQPKRAAQKFTRKANELCLGRAYRESEIREWSMEIPPSLTSPGTTVTIRDGIVKCG